MSKIRFFKTTGRPSQIARYYSHFFDGVQEFNPDVLFLNARILTNDLHECTTVVLEEQFEYRNPQLAERVMTKIWQSLPNPYTRIIFLTDMFPYHRDRALSINVDAFGPTELLGRNHNWFFTLLERGEVTNDELRLRGVDVMSAPDAPRSFPEGNQLPWFARR